jgi:hypothetical protein
MSTSRCSSGRRAASAQLVMVWSPQKKGQVQWPGTACIVYLPGVDSSWRKSDPKSDPIQKQPIATSFVSQILSLVTASTRSGEHQFH